MKRVTSGGALMVLTLLVGTAGLGWAVSAVGHGRGYDVAAVLAHAGPRPAAAPEVARLAPDQVLPPADAPATSPPARDSVAPHAVAPRPPATPGPGRRVLGPGDHGPRVREVQARLRQLLWFVGDVGDTWDAHTTASVRGFLRKHHLPVAGYLDRRSLAALDRLTTTPSADELANRLPGDLHTTARLDTRCTTGRALCIDKTGRTLRWVVDGKVLRTFAVRFGAAYTPTREGLFHVDRKAADWVSTLYGSAMPFAMFFSGGQAVHYSSDFAARGYLGASHGCVNVRDYPGLKWLFGQVHVGDKVVVYWS